MKNMFPMKNVKNETFEKICSFEGKHALSAEIAKLTCLLI